MDFYLHRHIAELVNGVNYPFKSGYTYTHTHTHTHTHRERERERERERVCIK